jgi:hypothetical protein
VAVWYPRCHAQLLAVVDGRGGPDSISRLIDIAPKDCVLLRNGYHEADTFSLEFDARKLPIDPEVIKSLAVRIFMFNADGKDDQSDPALEGRERLRGIADDDGIELSDDGQLVTVTGRDYTGLLLDAEWDPRNHIPSGGALDLTIQTIADAAAPPGALARFVVEAHGLAMPKVGSAHRSTKKKGLWVKPGKTYWDVIYEMALAHGFIAYVKGETIFITEPRSQTIASAAAAPQLIYGKNLRRLKMSRKLTKEKVPQVVVTAWDPVRGDVVRVTYPEKPETTAKASGPNMPALGMKRNETIFLPGPAGVTDLETLKRYARVRFANMARSEAEYECETHDLRSFDGQDLFELDAGAPLIIGFDPYNGEQMRSLSVAERVRHLVAQGYAHDVSELLAESYERVSQLQQAHYTRSVEFHFSQDEGITIQPTAINYAYEPRETLREQLERVNGG